MTVRLVGELDLATAEGFAAKIDQLVAEGFKHLVLDLRRLTFMDSSGLRAIVKLHKSVIPAASMEIIDGPDHVQRVFTITGLRRLLSFVDESEPLDPPE